MSATLTMQADLLEMPLDTAASSNGYIDPIQTPHQRPLWLTQSEAEALMAFCVSSLCGGGDSDVGLFHKLGEYIHSFRG